MYAEDKTTIVDRRELLKIKLKSLAAEAKIIRHQERKSWGRLRDEMHSHRLLVVRYEARHTHLAYGLIRGLTIEQMEAKSDKPPNMEKVLDMVERYGSAEIAKAIRTQKKETKLDGSRLMDWAVRLFKKAA